jgi:hypothetical protein
MSIHCSPFREGAYFVEFGDDKCWESQHEMSVGSSS